jgi:hypothetical protein
MRPSRFHGGTAANTIYTNHTENNSTLTHTLYSAHPFARHAESRGITGVSCGTCLRTTPRLMYRITLRGDDVCDERCSHISRRRIGDDIIYFAAAEESVPGILSRHDRQAVRRSRVANLALHCMQSVGCPTAFTVGSLAPPPPCTWRAPSGSWPGSPPSSPQTP